MIGLVGYFGYGNYGDEMFYQIWREHLGYDKTVMLHPADDLSKIDKIVIGGGDLFWPLEINNNYFNEWWYEGKRKVYIYGIGVPKPIRGDVIDSNVLALYRRFFNSAEYLSVRDAASFYYIRDYIGIPKVQLVEDLAWCYKPQIKFKKSDTVIGITYRRNPWVNIDDVVKLCLYLIDIGLAVLLIPLQDGYMNTRELHQIIYDEVQRLTNYPNINIIPPNYDIDHKYAAISSCKAYITLAFHGMLTALRERVPVVCLNSSNKFNQLLKQLQMEDIACSIPEQLPKKSKWLLSGKYKFENDKIEYAKSRANENLEFFIEKYELTTKHKRN